MSGTLQVSAVCRECGASLSFPLGATQVQCSYCGGGMAVAGVGLMRLDCPSCKGNFYYVDGTMAGRCPYCEAPLVVLTRHRVLRYVIPPRAEARPPVDDAELVLLPFWRLSALVYGWDFGSKTEIVADSPAYTAVDTTGAQDGPSHSLRVDSGPLRAFRGRVIDRHMADPITLAHGVRSLRMRPAVFAMEPMRAEHERLARILPSSLDVEAAREALFEATMDLGRAVDGLTKLQCQRADVVADSLSLLYYPFWLKGSGAAAEAWDGVTGNSEPVAAPGAMPEQVETAVFDDLKVVEARCKSCFEPLPPGNRAVVFPCHSCGTFWVAEREDLRPFQASYAQPLLPAPDGQLFWLPFWRVEAEVEYRGRAARAVADVRTVLGVLGSKSEGPTSPPDSQLAYYAPAYGTMRAPKLDSTARDMTRLQPLLEPGSFVRGHAWNCFFGPEDAERLAYVVVLQVMPGSTPALVSSLRVRPVRVDLWYVPFADEGREVRNLLTGLRYDRDSLRGVGH